MKRPEVGSDSELYDDIDACQATIAKAQREQLRLIAEFDRRELWQHDGCYHMGQWLAGWTRYEPGLRINRQRDDGDDDDQDESPDTSGGSRLALIAAAFG